MPVACTHLLHTLLHCAPDPTSHPHAHTRATLLTNTCTQMLIEPKIVDTARLAAFIKRLAATALGCSPAEALVLLGALQRWVAALGVC